MCHLSPLLAPVPSVRQELLVMSLQESPRQGFASCLFGVLGIPRRSLKGAEETPRAQVTRPQLTPPSVRAELLRSV